MRKILLMSSALALLSGVAEAACIQTPTCGAMGYDSTVACEGGIKCPFGNAWNCTLADKIAQLEITIEKLEQTAQQEALAKCKIGDILYHDMSCNTNVVASKTPIGVIFDVTNGLAVAKDEFTNLAWGPNVDISGIQNYSTNTTATADWQGFNNTKAIYEYRKTKGGSFQAAEKALVYSTEGTSQGQWYLPAAGELKAVSDNKSTLNTTLSKIGGTSLSLSDWTSSEKDSTNAFFLSSSTLGSNKKGISANIRPVINFISKDKIDVGAVFCDVGNILYSDKKCYLEGFASGKTPIGVVFDSQNRKAIALEKPSLLKWAVKEVNIPGIPDIEGTSQAAQDFNGKANTAAIKAYDSSFSNFPAAKYAYNYTTTGTNVGDWYLPALGELYKVYQNQYAINKALLSLGKSKLSNGREYWSSSESNDGMSAYYYAWQLSFHDGEIDGMYKNRYYYVLPVLAF